MLGAVRQPVAVADHELCAGIADAVVEFLLGEPPGERDEHGARPLRSPVEQGRLEPVVEDDRDPVAGLGSEPAGDPRYSRQQHVVADPGERLELGVPLAGREERLREVHRPAFLARDRSSRASSIAATMGV